MLVIRCYLFVGFGFFWGECLLKVHAFDSHLSEDLGVTAVASLGSF